MTSLPDAPGPRTHAEIDISGIGRRNAVKGVYSRYASIYDERWRRYLEETIERTVRSVGEVDGLSVLDVGCGTGLLISALRTRGTPSLTLGVDLSSEMIEVAAGAPGKVGFWTLADAAKLPIRDRSFDLVVSSSSMHHWPAPSAAFEEMFRVLRPGGRLVVSTWRRDSWFFFPLAVLLKRVDSSIERIYTSGEVEQVARVAGFRIERVKRYRVARWWAMVTVTAVRPRLNGGRALSK
jgi:ubiquinone/menaquinone biosynthesis C-methylase UbiE